MARYRIKNNDRVLLHFRYTEKYNLPPAKDVATAMLLKRGIPEDGTWLERLHLVRDHREEGLGWHRYTRRF
jgi:hypothetical protein